MPDWTPPVPHQPATLNVPDIAGRMPLSEQLAEFDSRIEAAVERATFQLTNGSLLAVLKRSARRRLEKGAAEFGDAGWRKHPDELMVDTIEELADALVYLVMRDFARSGGPGERHPLA